MVRKLLIIIFIITLVNIRHSIAQTISTLTFEQLLHIPPPQLYDALRHPLPDTVQGKVFIVLGILKETRPGSEKEDMDSAIYYLEKANLLLNRHKVYSLKYEIFTDLGILYFHNNDPEKGRLYFISGIDFCRKAGYKEQEASMWVEYAKVDRSSDSLREIYLDRALTIYQSAHNQLKVAETMKEMADLHLGQGKYELSEHELNKVLAIYQAANYRQIYYTYDLLSAVNQWRGDFAKAQANARMAIKKAEEDNDSLILVTFYWRLSDAYLGAKNYAQSQEYLKKSLMMSVRHRNSTLLYPVLWELTEQLIRDHKVKEALQYLLYVNARQPPVDNHEKIMLSFTMGDCYFALKDYTRAERYYLRYADQLGSGDNMIAALMKITQFYLERQQIGKAGIYLAKILEDASPRWDLNTCLQVTLLRFKVDSASGHLSTAIHDLQLYNRLSDSAFSLEKVKQAEEMQARFDLGNKEKDNQLLRHKSSLQAKTLEKATLEKNVIITGAVVLFLLLLLLLNRYRSKIKTNALLQSQQAEIRQAYAEKSKLLQDKEFLIKEIHHRVKNNLQLTMSLLNSQMKYMDNIAAIAAINDSQHRLRSISLVHQKLYLDDQEGLINIRQYIFEMLDYLKDSFGTGERIRFQLQVEDVQLDVSIAVPLGLILNEAITNIFKYAFPDNMPGQVFISIARKGNTVLFSIKDNGVGFPPGFEITSGGSMGFSLIRGLSTQLEADLQILQDNGVRISLQFQLGPTEF